MSHYADIEIDEMDEMQGLRISGLNQHAIQNRNKGKSQLKQRGIQQVKRPTQPVEDAEYPFSYHASRYEKQWLMGSISEVYEQNWIADILMMVKGGKEATVYLCSAPENVGQTLLAAKIYRPRQFRNLKKDHLYREGRDQLDATGKIILDDRAHHAMQKRTTFGLKLLHSSWVGHEFRTMQILAEAGVDIPRPYVSGDNIILMDFVGDELGGAPTLNTVTLNKGEARELFERVLHNLRLMLSVNRVHADLSAYNILYWQGEMRIIDFPQAINPDENHNAFRIFQRDVQRVCDYFQLQGVQSSAEKISQQLWKERGRNPVIPVDPVHLDADKEEDRRVWEKQRR